MGVDRNTVPLEIFPDEIDELRDLLPVWSSDRGPQAAGLYLHAHSRKRSDENEHRMVVALRSTVMRDPLSLVAVAAHELGHVILLGGKLMNADTGDHEPMTDLLTVFLGLGIFTEFRRTLPAISE